MTDLVLQCREFCSTCMSGDTCIDVMNDEPCRGKLADEIDRQAARIAELEAEKKNLLDVAAYYACDCESGTCLEFMRGEICGLRAKEVVKGAGLKTHNEWIAEAIAGQTEIERLRDAANDLAQYVSRADWYHYVKPETRAALGDGEND